MAATTVRITKTEPKCKLCRHPRRDEIDQLLLRRSNREKLPDGGMVNLDFVLDKLVELEVDNPTSDNIKTHWQKHCEIVSTESAEAERLVLQDLIEEVTPEQWRAMTADQKLNWIANAGLTQEMVRILQDGKTTISIDHVLRAMGEQRQRKQDETVGKLLNELGGGIAAALQRGQEPKQIESAEIVEGEVIEA